MGVKKLPNSLLIFFLVIFIFGIVLLAWMQINSQFEKVKRGRIPEINQSVNYTPWITQTVQTYPFDSQTKTGAVRDTNYGNRLSILGTLASLAENSLVLELPQGQLELNLSPEITYYSFDESKGINGLVQIPKNDINPGDRVLVAVQDNQETPFVFQIQKLTR